MGTYKNVGHFTGAGTTVIRRARKRAWIAPLVAASVLVAVGGWARHTMESALRQDAGGAVQAVLNANVNALTTWLDDEVAIIEAVGKSPHFPGQCARVVQGDAAAAAEIARAMAPLLEARSYYVGYAIVDPHGTIRASSLEPFVGQRADLTHPKLFARLLAGETVLTPPRRVRVDAKVPEEMREVLDAPAMLLATPVRNSDGEIIAAFGIRLSTAKLTSTMRAARLGDTGETYAFARDGTLMSESRFEDDLRAIGLLDKGESSMLNISIRDPGGNLVEGYETTAPRLNQPLTRMAAAAVTGKPGLDIDGYRDYRGVEVVGAWTWLDDYGFGVTSEIAADEAFHTLQILRVAFWTLLGLLLVALIGTFIYSRVVLRLQKQVSDVKQLGQYRLENKIGEGGMGAVYRASHALLRRACAVKILQEQMADEEGLARFEREVQITSQLTHPNTIAIYDYGRNEDGVFYYAMEYLEGTPLDTLVAEKGRQDPPFVVHVLKQVCGSLAEAHGVGLIHRDIKPANIMLCERGGVKDVAKVLDFGLVKTAKTDDAFKTQVGTIVGTPHYIAPETLMNPDAIDARADLYAVGGVAYFLLTGVPVFDGGSTIEVINKVVAQPPAPLSERAGYAIHRDLEDLVNRCLAKQPDDRPADAHEMLASLEKIQDAIGRWIPN